MNRSNWFWLLALGVSLLIHVGAVLLLWDRPLGQVDPQSLRESREVWRVRRSADDVILEFSANPGKQAAPTPTPTEPVMDLLTLSQNLLADDSSAPAPNDFDPALPLQPIATDHLQVESPSELTVDLPTLLGGRLLGPAPASAAFAPGSIEPDLGTGMEPGSQSDARRARAILAHAGLTPGHNPLPPKRPHVVELDPVDRRLIDSPLTLPDIAFVDIALKNTMQLDIPEHLDSDFDYNLSVWIDRKAKKSPYAYFRVDVTPKRSLRKLHTLPRDVVFVLDVSSSIEQEWINQSILGVWDALGRLNPEDRFNLVLFNEQAAALSNQGALPATEENLARANAFLRDTKSQGYTDVNRALSKLMIRDVAAERVYDIILISDGKPTRGVVDTRDLINLITKDNDLAASIYCVGVGARQDQALLNFLAYRNRGFSTFIRDFTEAREQLRRLTTRLRYPIMKDLKLDVVGVDDAEVYPRNLPNVHQGEPFSVFGVYERSGRFTLRVSGHNGQKKLDFTHGFNFAVADQADKKLGSDWAFWKLHHLYSRIIAEGERQTIMNQINELRKRYKLKTLY